MRKTLLALTATLALFIAACGGGTGTDTDTDTGSSPTLESPALSPDASLEASPSAS